MSIFIETKRLLLREIIENDFNDLSEMLKNTKIIFPQNEFFNHQKIQDWIDYNIKQYKKYGIGYLSVIRKFDLKSIGIVGIINYSENKEKFYELAYYIKEKFRNKGYANESAKACIDYVFNNLHANEVFSLIDKNNLVSIKIAKNLGMTLVDKFIINNLNILKYRIYRSI